MESMFWFQQTRPQTTLLLSVVNVSSEWPLQPISPKIFCMLWNAKTNFLRCIGYLSFTKDRSRDVCSEWPLQPFSPKIFYYN